MDDLFLKIVNMSISASWLILAVVLWRLALKKAPKWISCVLWALVAVRLICPLSLESAWSLIPNADPIPPEIFMAEPPESHGNATVDWVSNPKPPETSPAELDTNIDMLQTEHIYAALIWMAGVIVMAAYAVFSYIQLRHKVKASLHLQKNVWLCDEIATPFLLGFFRPRIYIPSGTEENQISHIIAHEDAHLRRKDHWWKPLGYLVLAVHWFNPLVWVAYILLCRDIELACDEKVIRDLDKAESIAYSEALLSCSMNRRIILVCPLAFGEVGVKERVKRVLNYKKPAFWVIIAAAVSCVILAVCFLTNPSSFPVKLETIKITEASTQDLRTNSGPTAFQLTSAEIDELTGRIKSLKIGRKDQELHGHTPLYSLFVDTEKMGRLTFSGFNSDGSHTAVLYDDVYYRITDSDFIGYLQHVCAGGTRTSAVKKDDTSWSMLDSAISAAILQHFVPSQPDGLFHVESHKTLHTSTPSDSGGKEITLYLLILHESFRPDSDPSQPLESVGGDYIPTVLTFHLSDTGEYILDEYWEPGDGGEYTDDLRAKFPDEALQKVWNKQDYVDALEAENRDKAKTLLKQQGDFNTLADSLIIPGQILKTYLYAGTDSLESAFITLYDDGTFQVSFSPLISYIGIGSYTIEDGRLTLNTDDGKFTYFFDMVDDTLVFDADSSSELVWPSGLEDGSVLYPSK